MRLDLGRRRVPARRLACTDGGGRYGAAVVHACSCSPPLAARSRRAGAPPTAVQPSVPPPQYATHSGPCSPPCSRRSPLALPAPGHLHVRARTTTSITLAWSGRRAPLRAAPPRTRRPPAAPRRPAGARQRPAPGASLPTGSVRACSGARCGRTVWIVAGTRLAGASTQIGGCPVFPADNAWNRDVSGDPVDPHSDATSPRCPATCIPTSARALRRLRHPVHGRPERRSRWRRSTSPPTATRATPARTRSARRAGRGRQRPPRARRPGGHVQALRALRRAPRRRRLERRRGRGVRPALEPRAPGGLDVGRRGRAADLPGPRAPRPDPPRAALHRPAARRAPTSTRRALRVQQHRSRACRRWACGCGCAPTTTLGLPRPGARRSSGRCAPTG